MGKESYAIPWSNVNEIKSPSLSKDQDFKYELLAILYAGVALKAKKLPYI